MKQRLQRILGCLALCGLLAGWLPAGVSAAPFRDVPESHSAAEAVRRCTELGILPGETSASFGLGHPITRADFAAAAARLFGWDTTAAVQRQTYPDVPGSAWYAGAVEAAAANGALTSQSGLFRPQDSLTREEMAVFLVRALGYGSIAGLAQELAIPFRDVRTNAGYIAIAYDFGLMGGTSRTTFSPSRPVTRENAAVILMRLYDKLQAPAVPRMGILSPAESLPDLTGYEVLAVPDGTLITAGGPSIAGRLPEAETAALRDAVRRAGAQAFLYLPGGSTALNGGTEETAAAVISTVAGDGYDGLVLDLGRLKTAQRPAMTALIKALKAGLGERPLFVAAEIPVWQTGAYEDWDGYDCAAIADSVDYLILRTAPVEEDGGSFPAAPVEPLENAYYSLGELAETVGRDKLSLMVTTTGTFFLDGHEESPLSRAELDTLLADEDTLNYYSGRYACAYLTFTLENKEAVAWHLDARAIGERARLAGMFGVETLFISDLNNLPQSAQ